MKKRLSLILALFVLIPSFAQAGGKKFHEKHRAMQRLNTFVSDNYADVQDDNTFELFFEEDKKDARNDLAKLSPNQRSLYSQRMHQRKQQLYNQRYPRDLKQERAERAERNRINRERNRAQRTNPSAQRVTKTKKKKKPRTFKEQIARWAIKQFTNNPLRTLTFLGGLGIGGYKLWQMFNAHRGNNPQPNQPANEQVQCLRCQQQKPVNQIIRLTCNHAFCGNCLHRLTTREHNRRRECPVLDCRRHLCGDQCRRTANHNSPCDDHIEQLNVDINRTRQNQRVGLNNNQNNLNNGGLQRNQQQPQQQQGGVFDMLLRMGTMWAMKMFGF